MILKSILLSSLLSFGLLTATIAQTTINTEHFDGVVSPAIPANWTSSNVTGVTWRTDSAAANVSAGYPGASGLNNMLIRNSDPAGTYVLTSPVIATTGFKDILVTWGSRVSTNFLTPGSTTPIFEYTINGGTTWSAVSYVENTANSIWAPVNGGSDIALPANTNNTSGLQFRWTVTIVNDSNGTYRIDDFMLKGTVLTGVNDYTSSNKITIYPNPATDVISFKDASSTDLNDMTIYDMNGKMITKINAIKFPYTFNCNHLSAGNYIAAFQNSKGERISTSNFEIK